MAAWAKRIDAAEAIIIFDVFSWVNLLIYVCTY